MALILASVGYRHLVFNEVHQAVFSALVEDVRTTRCCRLTYEDLIEGAQAVATFRS